MTSCQKPSKSSFQPLTMLCKSKISLYKKSKQKKRHDSWSIQFQVCSLGQNCINGNNSPSTRISTAINYSINKKREIRQKNIFIVGICIWNMNMKLKPRFVHRYYEYCPHESYYEFRFCFGFGIRWLWRLMYHQKQKRTIPYVTWVISD